MGSRTDESDRLLYSEPLLREHGSLRDLTGKTGEKGKDKESDKNQLKDLSDKDFVKESQDKGTF